MRKKDIHSYDQEDDHKGRSALSEVQRRELEPRPVGEKVKIAGENPYAQVALKRAQIERGVNRHLSKEFKGDSLVTDALSFLTASETARFPRMDQDELEEVAERLAQRITKKISEREEQRHVLEERLAKLFQKKKAA